TSPSSPLSLHDALPISVLIDVDIGVCRCPAGPELLDAVGVHIGHVAARRIVVGRGRHGCQLPIVSLVGVTNARPNGYVPFLTYRSEEHTSELQSRENLV